jgi:4-coumarate--CoA ligase (photoactive yellow protein activation family)
MTDFALGETDIARLTIALIADEIELQSKKTVGPEIWSAWTSETRIDEDGIGLDSLARLDLAGRFNSYFHLHEVGIEDYLLLEKTIGGWARIVAKALSIASERITFQTSGSTGVAKQCTHAFADLNAETREHARLLAGTKRILSLVPPHHIYGFLFSVRLPAALNIPVIDARALPPGRLLGDLMEGDLLVATPFLFRYLERSCPAFPAGIQAVTSTAPMPPDLREALAAKGLTALMEIYGSSETAGIGWRTSSHEGFTLFKAWRRHGDDLARNERTFETPDQVVWVDQRTLKPVGRRDGAVQVGGINVFPQQIAETLKELPFVAECVVRLQANDNDKARSRLAAFVVLADATLDTEAARIAILKHCAEKLRAAERPVSLDFGQALPVNAMGKLAAW